MLRKLSSGFRFAGSPPHRDIGCFTRWLRCLGRALGADETLYSMLMESYFSVASNSITD